MEGLLGVLGVFLLIVQFSTPVSLAAIGETVGQRSGVLNIGLEGTMLMAAYAGVVVSGGTGNVWWGVLAGVGVGLVVGLAQAFFTVVLATDQVVAGMAVNLFGLGLTGTLFDIGAGQGVGFSGVPALPKVGGVDVLMLLLPFLAWGAHWLLFGSKLGLVLRAAGEYPPAAESAGYSVVKLRLAGQAVSGVFAGLAGAYLSLGIAGSFAENMTVGKGFIAIALVTFGRWKPGWTVGAALLIGLLDWAQVALQGRTPLPVQFFTALPYLAALGVLVVVGKGTLAPGALGVAFRRER